jgi:hypothetical protein
VRSVDIRTNFIDDYNYKNKEIEYQFFNGKTLLWLITGEDNKYNLYKINTKTKKSEKLKTSKNMKILLDMIPKK